MASSDPDLDGLISETVDYRVIVAATTGRVSGVDVFSVDLVRGLNRLEIPAHILLTRPELQPPDRMALPSDVPIERLPVDRRESWRARWRAMMRYVEERAPCIYIPNYDWYHSCVSPKLSEEVAVVGIVHSDDPRHYEHVARLGAYWNAVVAVSDAIARHTAALYPTLEPRLVTIPYGVEVPSRLPDRQGGEDAPLRIVYAGRLVQEQKRVLDLPQIARALVERGVPMELTVVGGGTEEQQVQDACAELSLHGHVKFLGIVPNDQVLEVFAQSEVFLLTSAFEGLPLSLLEAMGRGCVPVVSDIRSGIPEVVQDGVNGYTVPVGDVKGFAERVTLLQSDLALRRQLSMQAYRTIRDGGYRVEDMVERYRSLFQRVFEETARGFYRRPRGKILPPPSLEAEVSWKGRLPAPLRSLGVWAKRRLRRAAAGHKRDA